MELFFLLSSLFTLDCLSCASACESVCECVAVSIELHFFSFFNTRQKTLPIFLFYFVKNYCSITHTFLSLRKLEHFVVVNVLFVFNDDRQQQQQQQQLRFFFLCSFFPVIFLWIIIQCRDAQFLLLLLLLPPPLSPVHRPCNSTTRIQRHTQLLSRYVHA